MRMNVELWNAWLLPLLCGAASGVLSAWGIGGGTLLLLCMTLLLGVEQKTAQAINLLYFLPTAGISVFFHAKNGYLERDTLRAAVPAGTLSALAAALFATSIDLAALRRPFGLFLLYAGLSMLWKRPADNGQNQSRK